MALDLSKCWRAKVVSNNYRLAPANTPLGSVELFVPDWNAEKKVGKGTVWAAPINASFTGSDTSPVKNVGQCIIPQVNSYVWVAIEDGDYKKAYYFGSYPVDTVQTIPHENKQLKHPQDAFTILKTPKGRGIVVVDDGPDNKGGIVIKGRSSNSKSSVLGDSNQMFITLSENSTNGILIQTGNGDQAIFIDKASNTTEIRQGDSRIFMTNDKIDIESNTVNIVGHNRINLN